LLERIGGIREKCLEICFHVELESLPDDFVLRPEAAREFEEAVRYYRARGRVLEEADSTPHAGGFSARALSGQLECFGVSCLNVQRAARDG
jgi:hypothetical protein